MNTGYNYGAVGLDDVQVLTPSGSDPNAATESACQPGQAAGGEGGGQPLTSVSPSGETNPGPPPPPDSGSTPSTANLTKLLKKKKKVKIRIRTKSKAKTKTGAIKQQQS